ncbi:MAG: hypothetical protein ACRDSE_10775, partial [Pseudonocardiaceae bacterium]
MRYIAQGWKVTDLQVLADVGPVPDHETLHESWLNMVREATVGVVDPEHWKCGEHAAEAEAGLPVGVGTLGPGQGIREAEGTGVAIPDRD